MKKNKVLIALWAFVIIGIGAIKVFSNNTDAFSLQGAGTFNNVDVFRIDSNSNVFISSYNSSGYAAVPHTSITNQGVFTHYGSVIISSSSKLFFGPTTTAVSTTATSGSSQGIEFTGYLDVGGSTVAAAVEGTMICAATTTNPSAGNLVTVMACPKTLGYGPWIGVAATAASTGAVVNIYDRGWVLALTTGTVKAGDMVQVSTQSTGYLETTAVSTATWVGIALGPGNANGGLTRVKLK